MSFLNKIINVLRSKYTKAEFINKPYIPDKEVNTVFDKEFALNTDYERRDEILNIKTDWGSRNRKGGVVKFDNLDVKTLEILLKERHINPADRQNASPTIKEFFEFMCRYPQTMVFGYAVSPLRKDYRVSIEGIRVSKDKVNPILKKDFVIFCIDSDELITDDYLYAWWD